MLVPEDILYIQNKFTFIYFIFFSLIFEVKVSDSPSQPQAYFIAKAGLEFLIFLLLTPEYWGTEYNTCATHPAYIFQSAFKQYYNNVPPTCNLIKQNLFLSYSVASNSLLYNECIISLYILADIFKPYHIEVSLVTVILFHKLVQTGTLTLEYMNNKNEKITGYCSVLPSMGFRSQFTTFTYDLLNNSGSAVRF